MTYANEKAVEDEPIVEIMHAWVDGVVGRVSALDLVLVNVLVFAF